jgi:hypothetical protein
VAEIRPETDHRRLGAKGHDSERVLGRDETEANAKSKMKCKANLIVVVARGRRETRRARKGAEHGG